MIQNLVGTAGAVAVRQLTQTLGVSVIGSLGQMPFICSRQVVLTFNDLQRVNSVRWAKHDVIGKKPILEYVGGELSSVSFTMRFDTSLGIPPMIALEHLKNMMENKKYKTLIIGGEYLGKFVIDSISEGRKFHTGAGVCQVATADISLTEFATNSNKDNVINDFFGQFE